jgi:glycerol-1-phosphate dehydrogenase [NAD(P)+]
MSAENIARALRGAPNTREVVIGRGVLSQVPVVFQRQFGAATAMIVADSNTYAAAGRAVEESLQRAGIRLRPPHVFPGSPTLHADVEHVDTLEAGLTSSEVIPIAVGSGTLNDLTKLAAHRRRRGYMSVATAASMDGYTAFAAAISHGGVKKVDACPAPRALVADLDVLSAAPSAMAPAGYADLVAKYVACADWIVADALGIEALDRGGWPIVESGLAVWTSDPMGVAAARPEAMEGLIEGLVLSGLAMQVAKSTRPASGSEHLFSHLWEMQGLRHDGRPVSHGFQVGLGTLAAASLFDRLLERERMSLDARRLQERWPSAAQLEAAIRREHPGGHVAEKAVEESKAKHLNARAYAKRLADIERLWPGLRVRLRAWLPTAVALRSMLELAGSPTQPESIGLTRERFRQSFARSREIRARYTCLDLAVESGLLEASLGSLFGPAGFWAAA